MRKKIIVIGGGLGGLSAAIHLAVSGFQVELFEQNNTLGGKMNIVRQDGFQFDTGPSLLTMPFVIDELFRFADTPREKRLSFLPLSPLCRYFFHDKTIFNAYSDMALMQNELSRIFPGEEAAYRNFLDYSRKIYRAAAPLFLFTPFREPAHLFRAGFFKYLPGLPRIDALKTLHQAINGYFGHPHLIQLFDRYATYNGSDPFRAPATLNMIPFVEYGIGGFYIAGGMYRLVEELSALAEGAGVRIHLGTAADEILYKNKQITGVRIGNETVAADYVVSNADVVTTFNELITGFENRRRKLNRLEPSLSGMVFLWGMDTVFPQLTHHNIFFSGNYRREFRQIFQEHRTPEDPTIYISISARADTRHAPPNSENWFVLVNMPYQSRFQNWEQEAENMKNIVQRKLHSHGIDISGRIKTEQVMTPPDFYSSYGSNRGSIYGISSNNRRAAFRRPSNRSRDINGLYFCGGSVHPGGGIPLVLLSGRMTAQLITENAGYSAENYNKANFVLH